MKIQTKFEIENLSAILYAQHDNRPQISWSYEMTDTTSIKDQAFNIYQPPYDDNSLYLITGGNREFAMSKIFKFNKADGQIEWENFEPDNGIITGFTFASDKQTENQISELKNTFFACNNDKVFRMNSKGEKIWQRYTNLLGNDIKSVSMGLTFN